MDYPRTRYRYVLNCSERVSHPYPHRLPIAFVRRLRKDAIDSSPAITDPTVPNTTIAARIPTTTQSPLAPDCFDPFD